MSVKYFLMKKEFVKAASEQITGKEKRSKINISARKFVKKLRPLFITEQRNNKIVSLLGEDYFAGNSPSTIYEILMSKDRGNL